MREALKLALEALESTGLMWPHIENCVTAIQTVLAQTEPKPMAWLEEMPCEQGIERSVRMTTVKEVAEEWPNAISLYTTPPQRTWVGLTDEEIIDVIHPLVMADMADEATDYEIARAIEAKLKEKNT